MEPLIWQKVEWRQGDGCYRFELQQGGLHATLTSPHGQSLTIPMVAWYGLLDALAASRRTRDRADRGTQPPRAGARWSDAELAELLRAFHAGATIRALAQSHSRTEYAVETQLSQMGLWDRVLRQPLGMEKPGAAGGAKSAGTAVRGAAQGPRPWPPDYWDSAAATAAVPSPERAESADRTARGGRHATGPPPSAPRHAADGGRPPASRPEPA